MTPQEFVAKWRAGGDERRDAQPFFEDLCRLVGHPTPREADPEHTQFTYEYGASKTSGGEGWADVWKKGCFGWEAKGTGRSLEKAYEQLKMYADALQNPPLLVVSDLQQIVIHTNFTNTVKQVHRITVDELLDFDKRQILSAVFHAPESLRPGETRAAVTQKAANKFTDLARALRARDHGPEAVAHFLDRLLFCMFAEDIKILPNHVFTKLVKASLGRPETFESRCRDLFAAMRVGGDVAFENIAWFNGGLFDNDNVLALTEDELKLLHGACELDWSDIEPSIFGTLFERGLDPDKRSQLGAHYTDPDTIMKIVEPVVIAPWLARWDAEKAVLLPLLEKAALKESTRTDTTAQKTAKTKALNAARDRLNALLEELRHYTVLDPACGSGNFLYLSLKSLKDIEKRILIDAEMMGLGRQFPGVGPANVRGIELNAYAAELARVTIWIGEIQWMVQNGYGIKRDPILQPLDQIEHRDALINDDGTEATWPAAHAVVANPPFLGDKKMMGELGEPYVNRLRRVYRGRVPGSADLVCYWFEKCNDAMRAGTLSAAGLVATNSIRNGRNREVLRHIVERGHIFEAWSDEPWVKEGAAVRVSIVCFNGHASPARLDGQPVDTIHADLTGATAAGGADTTQARPLAENAGRCFVGYQKSGDFDVDGAQAREWLRAAGNPHGRPNTDVVFPYWNGLDVTRRPRDAWIIDFGVDMPEAEAAFYEGPFRHLQEHVRPKRLASKVVNEKAREALGNSWWRLWRPRPDLRAASAGMERVIVTPEVAKHRLFAWMPRPIAPDKNLMVTARDDDTTFGILHSRLHGIWALRVGSSLEDRPRYTPSVTFETFPFPAGLTPNVPAATYAADPRAVAIAEAARALVEARDRWLTPAEWVDIGPDVAPGLPPRAVPRPGHEGDLAQRTLTSLYNEQPAWLVGLHQRLDAAVAAAYGWEWPLAEFEALARLLALNAARRVSPAEAPDA